MAHPLKPLLLRQRALEHTLRKFRKRPYELGRFDCGKMARFHLVQMGHRKLPALGKYSGAIGARRALAAAIAQATGTSAAAVMKEGPTFEALFDQLLERIAPAAALPGDLGLLPEDPEDAVGLGGTMVVSLGGRKWAGWHPDAPGFAVLEPNADCPFLAVWRA